MSASLVGGSTVPDHGGRLLVSFDLVNRTALSWIYILLYVPVLWRALRCGYKKKKKKKWKKRIKKGEAEFQAREGRRKEEER